MKKAVWLAAMAGVVLAQEKSSFTPIKFDEAFTIEAAAFTPDGKSVFVVGGKTSKAEPIQGLFFDLQGKKTGELPVEQSTVNGGVAFSPDGKTLAIASQMGLELIDVAAKKRRCLIKKNEAGDLSEIRFSPDGTMVLSSLKGDAHVFSTADGKVLARSEDFGIGCFSGDGKHVIALPPANPGQLIWLDWKEAKQARTLEWTPPKDAKKTSLPQVYAVSPDGEIVYLVDASSGGVVPVEAKTGKGLCELRIAATDQELAVGPWFSSDGKWVAGLSMKAVTADATMYTLRIWSTGGWKEEMSICLEPKAAGAVGTHYSADGRHFLLGIGAEVRIYTLP